MKRLVSCCAVFLALLGTQESFAQSNARLDNAGVVKMVKAGLCEQIIITAIQGAADKKFDLSADALVALKAAGVSDTIIAAMQHAGGGTAVPDGARQATSTGITGQRWELEVHGGGAFGSNPTDGTGSVPPAGESFVTSSGQLSRRSSSWYFGDGAALINAVNGAFATGRITPLDPVLKQSGATRKNGGSIGFRVGYAITPRFGAEFTLDAAQGRLKLTDSLLGGVEASRASFIAAWNERSGLISTGGGVVFTNPNVSSTITIDDEQGRQLFTTGALTVNLATRSRVIPYGTIGAGVVSNTGDSPSITLTGNYRFASLNVAGPGTFQVNETDTVKIRLVAAHAHPFVTVFGGGVKMAASSRWGVRADIRACVSQNTIDMLVDASPQVATATPAGYIASVLVPSLQFSNNPSTGRQSTLSGPAIAGFKTFTGNGTPVHVSVSGGYFVRF